MFRGSRSGNTVRFKSKNALTFWVESRLDAALRLIVGMVLGDEVLRLAAGRAEDDPRAPLPGTVRVHRLHVHLVRRRTGVIQNLY